MLHLEAIGTAVCGTAKCSRLDQPKTLKEVKFRQGEHPVRKDRKKLMKWYQDKKEVYFMSTTHQAKSAPSGKRKRDSTDVSKPVLANDYNKYVHEIHRNDEMLGSYSLLTKSPKWRTKVVFHFTEEPVLNSFIPHDKMVHNKRFLSFK